MSDYYVHLWSSLPLLQGSYFPWGSHKNICPVSIFHFVQQRSIEKVSVSQLQSNVSQKKVQKVLLSCNSLHWAEQRLPSWRTANALLLTKACFLSQLFRIQQHDFRNSCRRGGYVKISELWDSVPDTFHKSLCYLLTIFFFQV